MAIVSVRTVFQCDIQRVWETVTSLTNYAWRSDLGRIEVLDEKQFVEYTKAGYATTFTVTAMELHQRWEFDMENDQMKGHWTGVFAQSGGRTEIAFTEDVSAKKLVMKPFVKAYLKKQQAQYIADLRRALA